MKKQLILVLALSTMLSVALTGCGSSKNDNGTSAASTNNSTEETSSSSVDTSNFVDFTVEGAEHKVTFKYDNESYELEEATLEMLDSINKCYVADKLGSVTVSMSHYNGQDMTAEDAEKRMTSNENMMNNHETKKSK